MSEWWTYGLSDFLLFSPRTYYRLFELYNAGIWPAQVVALALGAAIVVLSRRGDRGASRIVFTILAGCWLFVAWAFHLQRYATINWAATWFAAGFAIEGLLLLWTGLFRTRLRFRPGASMVEGAGLCLFLFALVIQPLIGRVAGRPWTQLELFGVAPDPTAVATLGILLLATKRVPWELLLVPFVWCAISGATLWTMQSPDALVTPLAALLAFLLAIWRTLSRRLAPEPI